MVHSDLSDYMACSGTPTTNKCASLEEPVLDSSPCEAFGDDCGNAPCCEHNVRIYLTSVKLLRLACCDCTAMTVALVDMTECVALCSL